MKKILLLFVSAFLINAKVHAQSWIMENSGFQTQYNYPVMIHVCNPQVTWTVANANGSGASQAFSKTVDGGNHWTAGSVTSNTEYGFAGLSAIDANTAYALMYNATTGLSGKLFKTANGGGLWNEIGIGQIWTHDCFPDILYFWDANNGMILGDPTSGANGNGGYFEIYTTSNAGVTWTRVPQANIPSPLPGELGVLLNSYSVVGNTIWVGSFGGARVLKSTDRGLHWTASGNIPVSAGADKIIYDVTFRDASNGVCYSDNTLFGTSDGGANWTALNVSGPLFHSSIKVIPGTAIYVSCQADFNARGSSYSMNNGVTWTLIDTAGAGTTNGYTALGFLNINTGYAGGFNFDQYTDGIYKWNPGAFSPCSGEPSPGITFSTANPACGSKPFTLSLQNNSGGNTYQWQSSPNNSNFSNIAGATNATYTTSITTSTYYRALVRCTSSGLSAFSTPVQIVVKNYHPVLTRTGSDSICVPGAVSFSANPNSHYLWSTGETTQSINLQLTSVFPQPDGGGIIWVVNPDSNFCVFASNVDTITVTQPPVINNTIDDQWGSTAIEMCQGDSVTLFASTIFYHGNNFYTDPQPEIHYRWSTGETTEIITVRNSGTYTVTVNGCSTSINVNTVAPPSCAAPGFLDAFPGNAGGTNREIKATIYWKKVSCAADYQLQYRKTGTTTWVTRNIMLSSPNTQYFDPFVYIEIVGLKLNTCYEYRVRSRCHSNPITYSNWTTPVFTPLLCIPPVLLRETAVLHPEAIVIDESAVNELVVAPNPVSTNLHINFQTGAGNADLIIFDVTGKEVIRKTIFSDTGEFAQTLSVSDLPSGLYLVTVLTEDYRISARLVKE